ncbi:hypothetical protein M885DRAFT_528363 [Pelagophyceae sp. CCMP2097]|nr:hypothetical protein M885DRAFT_528363 [Pelagophyceae sp. CCMP2097]
MALIIRCPASGRALHAIRATIDADLEALFLTEMTDGLNRTTFQRLILREKFGLRLDGREFARLARVLDANGTGVVRFSAFARHARRELDEARALGLFLTDASVPARDEARALDRAPAAWTVAPPSDTLRRSESAPAGTLRKSTVPSFVGQGVTTRRLHMEVTLARNAAARNAAAAAAAAGPRRSRRKEVKPRRGLLRHEITALTGAGILLTGDPGRPPRRTTVAQDSWRHPKEFFPTLLCKVAA